jgi:uncharacterized protein (TIGR02145 family)
MSLRKLNPIIWVAIAMIAAASCKKDDDEVSPALNGTLHFNVEEFVSPGYVAKMTPKGLKHPEGKGIGYYWKVTPGMTSADTTRLENGLNSQGHESDGTFTYWFPDTLGTLNVSCYGFAEGYTSSYASKYVTVVKPGVNGGSITRTGILSMDKHIEVDGIKYYYVTHNGLDWFRNNLANPAYGVPYTNAEAMSEVFGRYYSHAEATKACPEGWRLPTDAEWRELAESINSESKADEYEIIPAIAADLMVDAEFNSNAMWEYWPEVGEITNSSRLAILPCGYTNLGAQEADGSYPAAKFSGLNEYATFWTADMVGNEQEMAYYRYLITDQPGMQISKGDVNSLGVSVRCVREAE